VGDIEQAVEAVDPVGGDPEGAATAESDAALQARMAIVISESRALVAAVTADEPALGRAMPERRRRGVSGVKGVATPGVDPPEG
jgi:hypothetical protein